MLSAAAAVVVAVALVALGVRARRVWADADSRCAAVLLLAGGMGTLVALGAMAAQEGAWTAVLVAAAGVVALTAGAVARPRRATVAVLAAPAADATDATLRPAA